MQFQTYETNKKYQGTNTKEFLIVHHTAGGRTVDGTYYFPSFKGMVDLFTTGDRTVSVHFVIGAGGEIAMINDLDSILWHVGMGDAGDGIENLNFRCIGIEICSDGIHFTDAQRQATREVINYVISKTDITHEKILRHADVSGYRGKWDVGPNFYEGSWSDYQESFVHEPILADPRKVLERKYRGNKNRARILKKQIKEKRERLLEIEGEIVAMENQYSFLT